MFYILELKQGVSAYGNNLITELKPYRTLRGTDGLPDEVTAFTAPEMTASLTWEEIV